MTYLDEAKYRPLTDLYESALHTKEVLDKYPWGNGFGMHLIKKGAWMQAKMVYMDTRDGSNLNLKAYALMLELG